MSWTDERVEDLKRLWAEGHSASQIAARMGGVTRNAVIGKVHRLNLPGRAKSTQSGTKRSMSRSSAGRPTASRPIARSSGSAALQMETVTMAVADTRPVEDVVVPISRNLKLEQLSENTCKWPIGDPLHSDFHFCGNDSGDKGPYCSFHAKQAFQPASERRRSR